MKKTVYVVVMDDSVADPVIAVCSKESMANRISNLTDGAIVQPVVIDEVDLPPRMAYFKLEIFPDRIDIIKSAYHPYNDNDFFAPSRASVFLRAFVFARNKTEALKIGRGYQKELTDKDWWGEHLPTGVDEHTPLPTKKGKR